MKSSKIAISPIINLSNWTLFSSLYYLFCSRIVYHYSPTNDGLHIKSHTLRKNAKRLGVTIKHPTYDRVGYQVKEGTIVSGHVLISWTHTSKSTRYFGDAIRGVRSKHGRLCSPFEGKWINTVFFSGLFDY